jgi:hypothetical protein
VAPPPPDGSTGCVATIRRLMQGVGHTVPCSTSRQAAMQTRWVGWLGTGERYSVTSARAATSLARLLSISIQLQILGGHHCSPCCFVCAVLALAVRHWQRSTLLTLVELHTPTWPLALVVRWRPLRVGDTLPRLRRFVAGSATFLLGRTLG